MKRLGIFVLMLTLMSVSASADTYIPELVTDLMDTAWQTAVTAARQDPLRQQEVTAEKTIISYYDYMSETIDSKEIDVCSITDGTYTMQYIMQVIGEPDENGRERHKRCTLCESIFP